MRNTICPIMSYRSNGKPVLCAGKDCQTWWQCRKPGSPKKAIREILENTKMPLPMSNAEKVLQYKRDNPGITLREAAEAVGIRLIKKPESTKLGIPGSANAYRTEK